MKTKCEFVVNETKILTLAFAEEHSISFLHFDEEYLEAFYSMMDEELRGPFIPCRDEMFHDGEHMKSNLKGLAAVKGGSTCEYR